MILTLLGCATMLSTVEMKIDQGQNPIFDLAKFAPYTPKSGDGDYTIAPPYANPPEMTPRADVPKGTIYRFVMDSHDSKLYPGISKTTPHQIVPYTRNVTVYVPSGTDSKAAMPFFVSQDSLGSGEVPTVLDNMIADKRVPAQVAIFINSGGSDAQGSERGLEYDTMSGGYAEFIEYEVLPRVSKECNVTLSKDPDARMAMGSSSGAACAFSMAWYHNDWYHRVVSYSGTYVNQQWPPRRRRRTAHGNTTRTSFRRVRPSRFESGWKSARTTFERKTKKRPITTGSWQTNEWRRSLKRRNISISTSLPRAQDTATAECSGRRFLRLWNTCGRAIPSSVEITDCLHGSKHFGLPVIITV